MDSHHSPLALALGRIPTGLFVVSALDGNRPIGFIGSLVMQVAFEPPAVLVAIAEGREHLGVIRSQGRFALSVLDDSSRGLMGAFFKRYEPEQGPFEQVEHQTSPGGLPIPAAALAWMECRVTGEHPCGDHVVVFGQVEHGALLRAGDPAIHLRKNGLAY